MGHNHDATAVLVKLACITCCAFHGLDGHFSFTALDGLVEFAYMAKMFSFGRKIFLLTSYSSFCLRRRNTLFGSFFFLSIVKRLPDRFSGTSTKRQ